MPKPESEKDLSNVEAWAEIIGDLLYRIPPELRAEVLALATKNEAAEAQERATNEKFHMLKFMTFSDNWVNAPGERHWNAIIRLKSLLVQVFVRDITNNHSPEDARHILFAEHRYGTGSGRLQDYLPRMVA